MTDSSPPGMSDSALIRALKRESTSLDSGAGHDTARNPSNLFDVGQRLSEIYEIRGLLGRGGMGQVFEAYDHMLERTVAVKASWSHTEPGALLNEARGLAALAANGVPAVFSMGVHDGVEYCVMERLYGRTLASHMLQRLHDSRFEIDEVVEILLGIADALAEIHDAGLVHRDLKPANIMLAPGNRTVLFDFGLFSPKSAAGNEQVLAGSPRYLAPEAIQSQIVAGQTHLLDIYALGVIGHTLLSGRYPFNDPDTQQILWQHVHQPVPGLSNERPGVPRRLERLLEEMLAKDPLDRPFSADAIAAELGTIRSRLPTGIGLALDDDDSGELEIEPEDELAGWVLEEQEEEEQERRARQQAEQLLGSAVMPDAMPHRDD